MLELILVAVLATVASLFIVYHIGWRLSSAFAKKVLLHVVFISTFVAFYVLFEKTLFESVESGWLRIDLLSLFDRSDMPVEAYPVKGPLKPL